MIALVAPRYSQKTKLYGGAPLLIHLKEEIHGLFSQGYRFLRLSLAEGREAGVAQRVCGSQLVLELPEQTDAFLQQHFRR